MNSSQSLSKKGDLNNTGSQQMNQTGNINAANNSSTLTGKLQLLEEQIQLIALQRRISDLEMQVGNDDIKF